MKEIKDEKEVAEKAQVLIKAAAKKAEELIKAAAEKARLLLEDAAVDASLLVKEASVQATKEKKLFERKSKFLDIAAHELRNPITSISLLLHLGEKQIENGLPFSPDIVARLRPTVDRLGRLVVDFIEMSKMERGFLSLVLKKTNMASLISEYIREFQLQAPKRRFIFNNPDDQTVEINLDPIRIGQVLLNFLENAINYGGDGDIEVTLEVMPSAVRVSVKDHGPGIAEDEQLFIFNLFSRGNSNAGIHAGGLGLGLSICKGIMDLHQGTVGVTSKLGHGSTFYFDLPKRGTFL